MGFTGDPIAATIALEELDNYQKDLLTLERIKRIIITKLKQTKINNLGVKIIFSGRNKSNEFVTYYIDSKNNFEEKKYNVMHNSFTIVSALPSPEKDIQEIVNKHIYNTSPWKSIDEIKLHMRECIVDISKISDAVNSNIYEDMII